jgi:hypothetical protein
MEHHIDVNPPEMLAAGFASIYESLRPHLTQDIQKSKA